MLLHHEPVRAEGNPKGTVLFLHGILGRGGNLRAVAQRLVASAPALAAELVDLRAHGSSQGREGADVLAQTALDVAETAAALALPVRAVVGHSFGGKVALALTERMADLEHVVVLDASPSAKAGQERSRELLEVLRLLQELQGPFPTRAAFVAAVEGYGQPRALAQWLAMNLVVGAEGFRFGLSLPRIRALLDSYFEADLWAQVERAAREGPKVHLVIAGRSSALEPAERERARAIARASAGRVTVDEVDAGHWLHQEAPEALQEILGKRLVRDELGRP